METNLDQSRFTISCATLRTLYLLAESEGQHSLAYSLLQTTKWLVVNRETGGKLTHSADGQTIQLSSCDTKWTKRFFKDLWKRVELSGAGEPGFYFSNDKDWGTNPCCEIALRPFQFCNLCEVNVV